jgi:hypothetical protein
MLGLGTVTCTQELTSHMEVYLVAVSLMLLPFPQHASADADFFLTYVISKTKNFDLPHSLPWLR